MTLADTVLFLFHYHDGPIAGLCVGGVGVTYFSARFDEAADAYSPDYALLTLTDDEAAKARSLFDTAREVDPSCRDPARRAFSETLRTTLASADTSNDGRISTAHGTFKALSGGGAYGAYEVTWRAV